MSYVLLILCIAAVIVQVAILRDRSLPETELVEALRYLRVAAYGIMAVTLVYLIAVGHWLQPMPAISLTLLAFADTVGTLGRLFPRVLEHGR